MKKRTIKRTYFITEDSFIMNVFGLDGCNNPMIITEEDIMYLESYLNDFEDSDDDFDGTECWEIIDEIKEELKIVDEVQFIME